MKRLLVPVALAMLAASCSSEIDELKTFVRDSEKGLPRRIDPLPPVKPFEPFTYEGFEWIDCNDGDSSTLSFLRKGQSENEVVLVVCNFTPVPRDNFRIGVPRGGYWLERLNSDAREYGGGGIGNFGGVEAAPLPSHGRTHSLTLRLPPLATLFLTPA